MLHQDIVAVDAEIDGLLQPPLGNNNIVEGMTLPVGVAQHTHIQQHPVVQAVLSPRHGGELGLHLVHLAGGQKTAASQVDAQNGFVVTQRQIGDVQDGAVTADGEDHDALSQSSKGRYCTPERLQSFFMF